MLLSSPLLLFFVHFTSVLAFLCLFSLFLFCFSCPPCLFLFLFHLVSLCIICVCLFFVCVFLYYVFVVLPSFVALSVRPDFSGYVFGWLDQQTTMRGSWSSLLLEEGHKSLCLLSVSVFLPPCLFVSVCSGFYRAWECPFISPRIVWRLARFSRAW